MKLRPLLRILLLTYALFLALYMNHWGHILLLNGGVLVVLFGLPRFHAKMPGLRPIRGIAQGLLGGYLLALTFSTFFVGIYQVEQNSMIDALYPGDMVIVEKFQLGLMAPYLFFPSKESAVVPRFYMRNTIPYEQGSVIVFHSPIEKNVVLIKRLIKTEFEKILPEDLVPEGADFSFDEKVTGTGREPPASIKKHGLVATRAFLDGAKPGMQVPKGMVFVRGDNALASEDSRYWGFVPVEYIIGSVIGVLKKR